MKFSLKFYLLLIGIVGALLGIAGRLLATNPEMLQDTLQVLGMPVAFVASLGLLLWTAVRKPSPWSSPVCAGCGANVARQSPHECVSCPNCQADLNEAGAIDFAKPTRHNRFRLLAIAVVALPFVCSGINLLLFSGAQPISYLSDRRLIDERLPGKLDEPWVWQELQRRLDAGTLEEDSAERATRSLIDQHAKKTGPPQPLHWGGNFLRNVLQREMLRPSTRNQLFTLLGGTPKMNLPRTAAERSTFNVWIQAETWSAHNMQLVGRDLELQVADIRLNGEGLDPSRVAGSLGWQRDSIDFRLQGPWPKGEHQLEVDVRMRYPLHNPPVNSKDPADSEKTSQAEEMKEFTLTAPLSVQ